MLPRLILMFAVAAASVPQPVLAHDIYWSLENEWGESCCSDKDCRPTPYRLTAHGLEMLVDGHWLHVPREKVQYRSLLGDTGETDGGHWCGMHYGATYITRCAILPPEASSADFERLAVSGR